MKHVMEAADDAPLLYFGIPNKILTYSTVRKWFVKVTPKTLLTKITAIGLAMKSLTLEIIH